MTPVSILATFGVLMTLIAIGYCMCWIGTSEALERSEQQRCSELKTMATQAEEREKYVAELEEKIAMMEAVRTRTVQI